MAGTKAQAEAWRHTTVVIRADIFEAARARGIDLSNTANQALAGLLGIDYRQQKLNDVPAATPVIVAKDGGVFTPTVPVPKAGQKAPVINADDPKAAGAITKSRREGVKIPVQQPAGPTRAAEPARGAPQTASAKRPEPSPAAARPGKGKKAPAKKDLLKTFIAKNLVREDTGEAFISRDELYQIFARFCREQKSPVPEGKTVAVALKTRFAFRDATVDGVPCWTHVRLR